MPLIGWIAAGVAGNLVLGAAVLSAIDGDGRLFEWYKAAPSALIPPLVLTLWPVVAIAYFWKGKEQEP